MYSKGSSQHSGRKGVNTAFYGMNERLAVEDANKALVELLFCPNQVDDISSCAVERKSGTDFLLSPRNQDGTFGPPIRCENKFEQYVTGRQLFEIASLDRPRLVPGWMFTSRTAWLLSWYRSEELVAIPMDEARRLILDNPARYRTTTARNRTYLTWSALEDINYVVKNSENARVIDLSYELGRDPPAARMLKDCPPHKRCTADQLVELMRTLPSESTPVAVSDERLKELLRAMAPKNFKKDDHADMLGQLDWL